MNQLPTRSTYLAWTGLIGLLLFAGGCQQHFINSADREVNQVVRQRQQQALGITSDFELGEEDGLVGKPHSGAYDLVPHPIGPEVPESFRTVAEEYTFDPNADVDSNGTPAEELRKEFSLSDSLAYAFRHARDFQTRKEDLYLIALALTLERHLWTPQFVSEVSMEYANYGQQRDFDHAMTAVASLSASQRLPYGGEVAATVINSLMRDIGRHTTSGETGTAILQADIPLLRGAGKVARESKYQAERNLIYSVRNFESARRDLVVDVAAEFFDLLSLKTQIGTAVSARENARRDLERTQALVDVGISRQVEADRTEVQFLERSNQVFTTRTRYQAALDRFKIRIGMPTTQDIDVVDEGIEFLPPAVTEEQCLETALAYRLDLLNAVDSVDDAKRGVEIAKNNFLPEFDFSGSVSMSTDPNRKNSTSYNTERTEWRAMLNLEIPLDRKEERNAFRSSLIDFRRSERNLEEAEEYVRLEVRNALRNLEQAQVSMEIQAKNVKINEARIERARALRDRGAGTILDVVDAVDAHQQAQNQYADALAGYRQAVLSLLRDTGAMRVDDAGRLLNHQEQTELVDSQSSQP